MKLNIKKFKLRHYKREKGYIQYDPKVIGIKDNKFGQKIYILDSIDERTGLTFGEATIRKPKEVMIENLKKSIEFFELNLGCKIIQYQTDHELTYKPSEAINSGEFNRILEQHGIKHQFSIWSHPETDGLIERGHRVQDNELLAVINSCDTIEQAIEAANE
jgi:hypothetical protein